MDNDDDSALRSLFAAYAPAIEEEPFLARARAALAQREQTARRRARVRFVALLVIGLCIAALSAKPLRALSSGIGGTLATRIDEALATWGQILSPIGWQILTCSLAAAAAYLGRRRIRMFLAPW